MKIIDHSGDVREWKCRKCGMWQLDLIYDLQGRCENIQKPCKQCGYDPWTHSHPLRFRWIKRQETAEGEG